MYLYDIMYIASEPTQLQTIYSTLPGNMPLIPSQPKFLEISRGPSASPNFCRAGKTGRPSPFDDVGKGRMPNLCVWANFMFVKSWGVRAINQNEISDENQE